MSEWHRAHRVDGALGFAGEMLGGLLERRLVLPQLALPLGISFFTFQQISYLVDTCRGTQFRSSLKSKQFHRRWCSPAAHLYCEIAIVYQEFPSGRISREGSRGSSRKTVRIYLLIWSRMPCLLMFLGSQRSWLTQIR